MTTKDNISEMSQKVKQFALKLEQEQMASVIVLERFEATNSELAALKASYSKVEQEKAALQAEVMTTKDNISEMSQKVQQLQKSLEQEKASSMLTLKSSSDELVELKASMSKLEIERKDNSVVLAQERKSFYSNWELLEQEVEKNEQKASVLLEKEKAALQEMSQKVQQLQKSCNSAQSDLKSKSAELDNVRHIVLKLEQEKASTMLTLKSSSDELVELKATITKLDQEKLLSAAAFKVTNSELAALQAEVMTAKDNISEMSQKVQQLQKSCNSAQSDLKSNSAELDNVRHIVLKLEQEKSALQTEVDAALKKVSANDSLLGKELKEMKKAIAEIKKEKSVVETSYKTACDELEAMRETIRLEAEKSTTSTAVTTNDSPLRSFSDDNTRVHTVAVEETSALKSLKEVEISKNIEEELADSESSVISTLIYITSNDDTMELVEEENNPLEESSSSTGKKRKIESLYDILFTSRSRKDLRTTQKNSKMLEHMKLDRNEFITELKQMKMSKHMEEDLLLYYDISNDISSE